MKELSFRMTDISRPHTRYHFSVDCFDPNHPQTENGAFDQSPPLVPIDTYNTTYRMECLGAALKRGMGGRLKYYLDSLNPATVIHTIQHSTVQYTNGMCGSFHGCRTKRRMES